MKIVGPQFHPIIGTCATSSLEPPAAPGRTAAGSWNTGVRTGPTTGHTGVKVFTDFQRGQLDLTDDKAVVKAIMNVVSEAASELGI